MLTAKQEKFSLNIAKGMTQSDAYRDAYDAENMTDEQIWTEACLVAKNQKVSKRIEELRSKAESKAIMTAIQRKEILTDIILNEGVDSKMKAIDILNKMDGEYIQKIQADVDNHIDINIEIDDVDE